MKASEVLQELREDEGSVTVIENRDEDGRVRYVTLWRFDGVNFSRTVVSPRGFPVWEAYGEDAARGRMERDLEAAEAKS